MASKSKQKGSSWEREIAKYLTEVYGQTFTRVPNSGAYVGGKNAFRMESLDAGQVRGFKGDIIPPSDWVSFNCEAKNYADFPFHQLLTGNVKILDSWIEQCTSVASGNDFSIIFLKVTRKGTFVAFPQATAQNKLQATNYVQYNSDKHGVWIIMDFQEFFSRNTEGFKTLCQFEQL